MGKSKKALIALLAAAGITCLGAAAACNKAPAYYKLTFEGKGVDYVLQNEMEGFISGGTVKSGSEVRFTVVMGASSVGEPSVLLNGQPLTPDESGCYAFNISSDSAVSVDGVGVLYNVNFNRYENVQNEAGEYVREERRINYLDENGNSVNDGVKVEGGTNCRFKLDVSVYYKQTGFKVRSNYDELTPDANGVYTIENVTANTTVDVMGLEQEDAFIARTDPTAADYGGKGTKTDPYILSKPIDLFYLAALSNSDFYAPNRFYAAYYELGADIDLKGEQLYVVGDNSVATAVFCGEFDGKGHTIKNFYITDEVVDQESFANEYLKYVGLFGFVAAQNTKPAVIKNVNLEGGKLYLHSAAAKEQGQAGGFIAGYAIGAEISGCSVAGEVIADSDNTYFAYAGGLVGIMQSAYNESVTPKIAYNSYVQSCTSSAVINATGGVYAAGGIVGYMVSADYSAISYVAGCTSNGSVTGAIRAGGVAGMLGVYSSVTDCTVTGKVHAVNTLLNNNINDEEYYYAFAGAVAGFAANDTVIAYCNGADADVAATAESGKKYSVCNTTKYGKLLGQGAEDGVESVEALAPVIVEGTPAAGIPESVKVNGVTYKPLPIINWYSNGEVALDEYKTTAEGRSWGYYFDEQLTKKVPYGFVPAKDVTLYCGYADYSKVAGTYYVRTSGGDRESYFTLTNDGKLIYRSGAISHTSEYCYDGSKVILSDSPLATIGYTADELNGVRFTFAGEVNGGVLTARAAIVKSGSSSAEEFAIVASKQLEGFGYGVYTGGGATYLFNRDGTGSYTAANGGTVRFSYSVDGNDITTENAAGDCWNGTLAHDGVTGKDLVAAMNGVTLTYGGVADFSNDAYAGVWFMPGLREQVEITLGLTSANGGEYGSATVFYAGGAIVTKAAQYDVTTVNGVDVIRIFVDDEELAEFVYDRTEKLINGSYYSLHYNQVFQLVNFYKYDALAGTWTTSDGGFASIKFNGKGDYDVPAAAATATMQATLEVKGSLTAVTAANETVRGTYERTASGYKVTLGGKTYNLTVVGGTAVMVDEDDPTNVINLSK